MSRHTVLIRLFAFIVLSTLVFVAMLPSSARAVCPDGMISYWKLNETSGAIYDDYYYVSDGVCAVACPTPTIGRIGGGQAFNGSTTGIDVPADPSFDWGATNSFSIEYWMKRVPGTLAANEVIVGRDDPTTLLHWWVGITNGSNVVVFVLRDTVGTIHVATGTTPVTDGAWHHVVAVRDAEEGEIRLYVDGVQEASTPGTYSAGFDSTTAALNIGWLNLSPYYHFDGTLDEVALYDRSLADTEISQHYHDGSIGLRWGYCGCGTQIKIMPLGDSITLGSNDAITDQNYMVGYCQKLYLDLIGRAYDVDFVGGLQAGQLAVPGFDYDHEGHSGWRDNEVAAAVYGWLQENPADVVLLHIGTNGLDTSPDDVEDILDEIDSYGEDITVILARIINRSTYSQTTTDFNDNIQQLAESRIVNGDKIIIVDQETALAYPNDMEDLLHPNTTGYEKMADIWLDALDDFLPVCGPTAPIITSSPVTTATVGIPYTYDVNASGNPNPTYSLSSVPDAGIDIDTATGLISWTPSAAGLFDVTVAASNLVGADNQTFTITVAEADCPADMISYWTLNEALGNSYADVINGNDGTCAYACPASTIGRVNGGQAFDGSTTGIDVPADLSFDWNATNSFSIEYWMKRVPGILAGNEVIVGRDDSTTLLHWWVGIKNGSNVVVFVLRDTVGTIHVATGTTPVTDGAWHHVVAVRDAEEGEIRLYFDGIQEASTPGTYSAGFDSVTAALNIGWLNLSGGYHFGGTLDELALYDRALPDVEIQQHYINGLAEHGYCTVFAPEIISTAVAEAAVGWLYTYDVNAAGNPEPIYTLDIPAPFGMTIDSESGLISWTPDVAGDYAVTVIATNGEVPDASQAFTIMVTVNSPPLADDQAVTTDEDTPEAVILTGSDPDGDPLTFTVVSGPAHGTLTGTPPALNYTPDADYNGTDSFTCQANDGLADSNIATVNITINPINDAPVAIDDAYGGVDEGGTLTIDAASGVLANDSDTENDSLTAVLVTTVSYGSFSFNAYGSFTYTHDGSENTSDTFTYKANDGAADSNVATVAITINPVNDAPVADDQAITTDEDTAVGITLTGSDPDGDPLTFTVVSGPAHGTLTGTAPALTYTPDADYNGTDSFTFKANDGSADSNIATVNITVNPINDVPVANNDAYSGVDKGGTLIIGVANGVLCNDSDTEDNPLTAGLVDSVLHGTLTLNADGSFTYTHNGTENTSDSFTYRANDGAADSNVATVAITIIPRRISLPGVLLLLL